jgi:hypothetical protein
MQSTGQASTHAVSLVPIQGSAITYAIGSPHSLMVRPTGGDRTQRWARDTEVRKLPESTTESLNRGPQAPAGAPESRPRRKPCRQGWKSRQPRRGRKDILVLRTELRDVFFRPCRGSRFGLTSGCRFDIVSNVLIYQRLVGGISRTLIFFGAGGGHVALRVEPSSRSTEVHAWGRSRQLVASMTRGLGRGQ